jgi:hypothetical protein
MADKQNAPYGLKPACSITGGAWTEKTNVYYIATKAGGDATYATPIFTGDPVIWNRVLQLGGEDVGSGTIARYGFNNDGNNAGNAVPVLGVFWGCEYTLATGELVKSKYWPGGVAVQAGSQIKAYIIDDPMVVYDIQVSTWTNIKNDARFTYAMFGQNFGFGLGGGGNQILPDNPADGTVRTGQSAVYLATTFTANDPAHTVVTLPLKAIGYTPNPQNGPASYTKDDTTSPFLSVRVMLNNHVYKVGNLGTVAA